MDDEGKTHMCRQRGR